jgi:hypothetical protein
MNATEYKVGCRVSECEAVATVGDLCGGHAAPPPVGYVLTSACNDGRQVAFVLQARVRDGELEVKLQKWRRQGRCWTQPAWYAADVIVGPATDADRRKYRVDQR